MQKKWKIIIGVIIAIVISGISIGIGLWKFADIDIVQQYKNKKIEANEKKENEEESIGTGSFQDGVKIISSRVNEELISINGKEDGISILKFNGEVPKEFDELEEEDIFVIEPNETLPEGFAGIFKSSEKDIVKVQTPELTEVFKDLEIDTKKSKELEVVGFTVNGKNMSTRGNSDNSLEEAIEDKTVQFHDDVKFDEKGTPYMDKLGITLKDFKPMDNDFVTLHGEISLEDLVFDLRLGIKDAILGEYGFNIYTDYTSNISMKIEANKKFEKDFEIVRLKLRTTGVSIALGEGIYKPRLGIEVVFMLGVNGEIYIEGEVAITNEGYVEIINKLDGFSFDSYSKIYGKNYPHKTVKSNESDIKDKKLKSELSLEVKGGMKTAINIPIKAAIYICKIEICSGTFRNGIEGTVESNGKVKVISGKKSKMEKGATIEANLDFVSGFELDGGGIKDLLETINIELENDLAIEKEILRINLLNFKYPDEIIEEDKEEIESNDKIVSYRTYKLCEYFSYGVDVEVIRGKKSEIINPSFILNKIAKNGFGLPEGTRVNSFKTKDGNIGYLDLTEQMNRVVGGSGFEEQRNAAIANTFMSAYGVNGLVITINGGCFDGGSHRSYGINEQLGTSLLIHDPTHNLEKYKEEVKKYTGDTVLEEGNISEVHSQEEIDKARKVLEDKYKTDFLYLDETCGAPEMFEPFNDEFILFLKNSGGDTPYSVKRGTNEIYRLLQPAEMISLEEFERRYPR